MGRRRRSPEGTIRRLPGLEQKGIWLRLRGAAASVITRADALTSEGAVGWLKAAHAKAFAGSIQRLVGLWVCFGKSDRDRCETDAGRSSGVRGPGRPHARPPESTIECSSGSTARLPPYGGAGQIIRSASAHVSSCNGCCDPSIEGAPAPRDAAGELDSTIDREVQVGSGDTKSSTIRSHRPRK